MNFEQYAFKKVGNAYCFGERDCEALVIEALKIIHGINVDRLTIKDFEPCNESEAVIFACRGSDNIHNHVGLYDQKYGYLHAIGSPSSNFGQVCLHGKREFKSFLKRISLSDKPIEFYKCRK